MATTRIQTHVEAPTPGFMQLEKPTALEAGARASSEVLPVGEATPICTEAKQPFVQQETSALAAETRAQVLAKDNATHAFM